MFQKIMQRIQAAEPAPIWSLGSAFLFTGAFILVSILAQTLVVTVFGGGLAPIINPNAVAVGVGLACLLNAVVIVQWVARRVKGGSVAGALRYAQSSPLPVFVVVLLGLAGAYAIDLLGVLINAKGGLIVPPEFVTLTAPADGLLYWAVAALIIIVVQPIGEELLFHGLLYPALAAQFRNIGALLGTAAIYAIVHLVLSSQGSIWFAVLQPFLMAAWVGILRAYTQSTRVAIITRAMFGLFFVLSALILSGVR
jgi:membrane protease YdiL (CAAX protease family)